MDDQTRERRLARRPVRRPELAPEGQRDTLFGKLLVDTGGGEGLENGYFSRQLSDALKHAQKLRHSVDLVISTHSVTKIRWTHTLGYIEGGAEIRLALVCKSDSSEETHPRALLRQVSTCVFELT